MEGPGTLNRRPLTAAAICFCLLAHTAAGQTQREQLRLDLRVDGFSGARESPAAGHLGAGVARRFGMMQAALSAGAGPSRTGASAHAEAAIRFHMDPYRERRLGLYGAAGGGVRWAEGDQPYLLLLLGVEGRRRANGWAPFFEAGVSRGGRIAAGLRRVPRNRR